MKHTRQDLKIMQGWSLERKIRVTQTRIMEWYMRYDGQAFISFSGGKDSTVLLDLARRVYPDIPAVYVDTGLEYPELRDFVKTKDNVIWLRPRYPFTQILEKYGYPIISKEISDVINGARKGQPYRLARINGELLDKNGKRFTDELQPRDVVTAAIREQMKKDGTDHVWLSMERIDKDTILNHFPNIYEHCLEEGYDVTKEWIPVVPAQHYFMGGIWVDSDSQTSMEHLFAAGETSCNGVHGANRLASNSLLESLVFAKRAAQKIEAELDAGGEAEQLDETA